MTHEGAISFQDSAWLCILTVKLTACLCLCAVVCRLQFDQCPDREDPVPDPPDKPDSNSIHSLHPAAASYVAVSNAPIPQQNATRGRRPKRNAALHVANL